MERNMVGCVVRFVVAVLVVGFGIAGFASNVPPSQYNLLNTNVDVCTNGGISQCKGPAFLLHNDQQTNLTSYSFGSITDPSLQGFGHAFASAFYGSLHDKAEVTPPVDPLAPYYPYARYVDQAMANSMFLDALVVSTDNPQVAITSLDVTALFHGTLDPSAIDANAFGTITIGTTPFGTDIYEHHFNFTQPGSERFHIPVTVQPGQVFYVFEYLQVEATGNSKDGLPVTANFQDTANLYIDSLTPGAELISASGHDYSTPTVPEPSSLSLLVMTLGIAALSQLTRLRLTTSSANSAAKSPPSLPAISMDTLSMGMSHDFEVAIEEGSTCVRIGTAIFGTRNVR